MPITTTPSGGVSSAQLAGGTLPASFTTLAASSDVTVSAAGGTFPKISLGANGIAGVITLQHPNGLTLNYGNTINFAPVLSVDTTITRTAAGVLSIGTGLQFGGTSASFPQLKRNTTALNVRLADDSADAGLTCGALSTSGAVTVTGADFICATAGKGLQLKSGTGARAGNAVLVGGTVTVTNTTVTANTIIYCCRKTAGGTLGQSLSYTVSAGTSFTITSVDATGVLSALDTSTVSFIIVELN